MESSIIHIATDIDTEALFEEIEFCKCVGGHMNPFWAIPLSQVYSLLGKYFPQLKDTFEWRQSQL